MVALADVLVGASDRLFPVRSRDRGGNVPRHLALRGLRLAAGERQYSGRSVTKGARLGWSGNCESRFGLGRENLYASFSFGLN